jgi:protein-S-isoprenylcysteine O-methyltransferase Ste14
MIVATPRPDDRTAVSTQMRGDESMLSIHDSVELIARLWILMLLLFFAASGYRSAQQDKASQLFMIATLAIVLPVVENSGRIGRTGLGEITWGFPWVSYFGFVLFFSGLALNWIGIGTLKKQWSVAVVVSQDHQLVDTGVYRFIRHPIYTGVLLELLGFGVALANWLSILLILLPNIASLAYRIIVEEKVLERHFGDQYRDYEHRTKRLIPGIF